MNENSIANMPLVFALPQMESVTVQRDVVYAQENSDDLTMDLYRPAESESATLPAVILVTGYADASDQGVFGYKLKEWAAYKGWARLIACSGMIAILYENMEPIRDLVRLVEHITTNAAHFGIDASRLALWSCSGNVPNALAFLPRRDVACAAFCYGYMTAEEEVEDAAKQFGFVLPNLEIEPAQLSSTPIFVVRAGRDETPHLNASLDRFVGEALDQNLPVTVLNLPDSPHGFDIFDASTRSRMAIRQILWFLKANLLTDRGD